jgi:hypothetical protein
MPIEYDNEDDSGWWKLDHKDGTVEVEVYYFPNGMAAVCEVRSGKQVPELQGAVRESGPLIHTAVREGLIKIRRWHQ